MSNAKGELFELCQARSWPFPDFSHSKQGEDHRLTFTCVAELNIGTLIQSIAQTGSTKKEAEQKASADLLQKLKNSPLVKGKSSSPLTPNSKGKISENPVGFIMEQHQKNHCKKPIFTFQSVGTGDVSMFECTCTFQTENGGGLKSVKASASSKNAAKTEAAKKAAEIIIDAAFD